MPERSAPGTASAVLAVLFTAGLAVFLLLRRPGLDLALHLYAVGMAGCLASAALARALAGLEAEPARFDLRRWALRRRPAPPAPVRELEEIERALDFSRASAFDVHYRLRPHLERAARHLLAVHRGLALESAAARELLGDEAWDLVRPGRPAPDDRHAPGLERPALRRVLARLEAL